MKTRKPTDPVHPGGILLEDFMKPAGISINGLASGLGVPPSRIHAIVNETRGITADTALRLARYFNMSAEFWMRLQMDYDLECASDAEESEIHEGIRPRASHATVEDAEQRVVA